MQVQIEGKAYFDVDVVGKIRVDEVAPDLCCCPLIDPDNLTIERALGKAYFYSLLFLLTAYREILERYTRLYSSKKMKLPKLLLRNC